MRPSFVVVLFVLVLGVCEFRPAAAQGCASGVVTASLSNDPGFQGLYKYCVEMSWDLGRYELGHLDVFLVLETCECVCHPSLIRFAIPAGSSTGLWNESPCTLLFLGEYACKGDPSIPSDLNGPAVKFEPVEGLSCAPGVMGSGKFCFYSPMPPNPPTEVQIGIAIKHGQQVCYGPLSGQLPSCRCALSTRPSTWGTLKATYR